MTAALAVSLVCGCDHSDDHDGSAAGTRDAGEDGRVISGNLAPPAECATDFPAFGCDGNPIGRWELVGLCFDTYADCPGASVSITGALQASLNIGGNGTFSHEYDLDYDQRLSVPQSCLDGGSCESIDCFGTNTCLCNHGTGSGGFQSGDWTMVAPGRVAMQMSDGLMELCAGDEYADSTGAGLRRIWRRTSERCAESSACDDGLACTQDYCANDTGACANIAVPTGGPEGWLTEPACRNGLDDDCDGMVDTDDPDCLTEPCTTAADCTDDGNPCTVTTCDNQGFCRTGDAPDGATCPGSDDCTNTYICRRDQCVPGPATLDSDSDGFVDSACQFGSDCDDGDDGIHFGAEGPRDDATCSDGIDNDCDGIVDVYDADCWEANCTDEGWCLEHPRPYAEDLNGMWARSADDIWAVADFGRIIHWDGTGWSRAAKPSAFAFEDVCGCPNGEAWAVGNGWGFFHYDGDQWSDVDTDLAGPSAYEGVDCLCDDAGEAVEVWAVGRRGGYAVYDGESLTYAEHPTVTSNLIGVWLAAAGEAWITGEDGVISHYSDGAWQDFPTGETDINAIWGVADDIWAVGVRTFLGFDGESGWNPVGALGSSVLYDIWGLDGQLWIAGQDVLYEYDPALREGTTHPLGLDPPTLRAVRGFGPEDMWAVGEAGAIVHLGEQGLTNNYLTTGDLWSVCGTEGANGTQRVWAAGFTEEGFYLRDEGGWQPIASPLEEWIRDLYCAGSYGVFAVGGESWVRWGDGILEGGTVPEIETADDLLAVDGRVGPNGVELIAVGDDTLIAYYDGQQWSIEYLSTSAFGEFNDVWMSPDPESPLQAVAVGYGGRCYLYDGEMWTPCDINVGDNLEAVWGDGQGGIWAVGAYGRLLSWTGTTFESLDVGQESEQLHDVMGTGPNDVWVLGNEHVWVFNGSSWTSEPMDITIPSAIYVTDTDVWVVGRYGAILHRPR